MKCEIDYQSIYMVSFFVHDMGLNIRTSTIIDIRLIMIEKYFGQHLLVSAQIKNFLIKKLSFGDFAGT